MAGAVVGGALLSAFLKVSFDRMASPEFVDFFRQRKLNKGILEKLKISMLSVHKLCEDAEEKQLTDLSVKEWLHMLKDVVYEAEDVLDEIATEALQCKLDAEFQTTATKVRNSISTFFNHFVKEIEPRIKMLLDKLEYLARQKDDLGLREGVGGESSKRFITTSLVEESGIFGRDDDKKTIISLLVSDDASCNENLSVIPIVGMGGIGKTTLAQLVYKDKMVKEHFDLQAWVCVSNEFDVLKLTKTMLEEVGSSANTDSKNLNLLQLTLNEKLMGKKFLLVLDDVWNENYVDWEMLCKPFKSGAPGSMVIVTIHNDDVASIMRTVPTHRLKTLLEEDCWSLFAKQAFLDGIFDARPELEVIGRQIVKKCDSLPLATKTIGALLRSKLNVDEWENILKSELWDSPIDKTNILPALRLSYKYLTPQLKQCFAYCSIFPKDYVLEKDQVVLLWMAEGFLEETKNKGMEEVGEDYFLALTSRSLLEQSSGNKSGFIMHNLVNDLAKFMSGQFTFRLKVDNSQEILNKTRHLSYLRETYNNFKKFEALYKSPRLHTFLPLELLPLVYSIFYLAKRVPLDLLPKLRCLRVLSLSHHYNRIELLESIGKLRHLRYLNLAFTKIKRLPNSICKLCNLQTLNLACCRDLAILPRDMWKLINLRHLDIIGTAIKEIPIQLSRLKCLRTLTKFIISKHSGACIEELGKLSNLRGRLSILELQNVVSPTDTLKACLKERKYLEELVLEWNALDTNISECQRSVLDNLQPHCNLKSLSINNYGAEIFPDWVGHHSFFNMVSIRLESCRHCCNLPPLGQLPSLRDLFVAGFEEVVKVDREFYGSNSSSTKPFGTLKVLRFERMFKWEEWTSFGAENEGGPFPQLEELYISFCPKLIGELPIHLPSLAKLETIECLQLAASLPRAPSLNELYLKNCTRVQLKELPTGLQKLKIEGFGALESLPQGLVDSNGCLQELTIEKCLKLELPTHLDFSSLETLNLDDCDSLKSFPLDLFPKLSYINISGCTNLESFTASEQEGRDLVTLHIHISSCPNFVSFPKGGIRAPNLQYFWVINCESLRSLPEKMHILLPSLKYFLIFHCPEVELLAEGGFPSNMEFLHVEYCKKLFASRMEWGLQKLSSITHLTIGSESKDVVYFPEPGLMPSCLTSLEINGFPNMKSLDKRGLQNLTSLQQLWVVDCPKLKYMPKEVLPASLSTIHIYSCPLLRKWWQSKKGKEGRKIPDVDNLIIDGEVYIG